MDDSEYQQRMVAYFELLKEKVREFGWVVQGVFPTREDEGLPFAYTIGLADAGLPELIISGLSNQVMGKQLLNNAAAKHLRDEIKPGDTVTEVANVNFRAVAADPGEAEVQQAWNYVGDPLRTTTKIKLVQLIWPDKAGVFPDQDGYDQTMPQEMWPLQDGQVG